MSNTHRRPRGVIAEALMVWIVGMVLLAAALLVIAWIAL